MTLTAELDGPAPAFAERLRSAYQDPRFGLSERLMRRVDELLALQPNWDGEGAEKPHPRLIADAVGLLVMLKAGIVGFCEPFVVATRSGGIQLEWAGERDLEMELGSGGWTLSGAESGEFGRRYHEGACAEHDMPALAEAFRWHLGEVSYWPLS